MTAPMASMPDESWGSRAEMMYARRTALDALERRAWSDRRRPLLGGIALGLLVVGELVAGATIAVAHWNEPGEAVSASVVVVVCVALMVAGAWLGLRTWCEGRHVIDALVAWEELTDRVPADGSLVASEDQEIQDATSAEGRQLIRQRNWVNFRVRTFTVPQMLRVALAVVAILPGLACVIGFARAPFSAEGLSQPAALALVPGLTLLLFGGVLFGGMQRFNNTIFRRWRFMKQFQSA